MANQQVWRYKSTQRARGLVLLALGVVKVATAGQLRQLVLPGTADEQTVRNACKDLRDAGLTESVGRTFRPGRTGKPVAQDLWNLTPAGLAAAASELGRPLTEMGSTARDAAKAGAPHALAVTDTIDAVRQAPPRPTKPVARHTAPAPRRELPVRPQGLGHLRGWSIEVALPTHGTFTTPAKGSLHTDAVLTAPEGGVPLLFVEVDNYSEPAAAVARKIADYRQFFRRRVADPGGRNIPMWSTLWPAPDLISHPPLALVFAKDIPEAVLQRRIDAVRDAAREHWAAPQTRSKARAVEAREEEGPRDYTDVVPVVTTTLALLTKYGPHGPVWTRFGRTHPESLTSALAHRNTMNDDLARTDRRHTGPRAETEGSTGESPTGARDHGAGGRSTDRTPDWACPSCSATTNPAAPGLDGYTPAPGERCPRCETIHRELVQQREQTGILARLRVRSPA
ncbi:replication-relaxation family protein [Streptomyces sp. NPDC006798]|uniref:replication-relaxation family protein n=1 Tax=Streptomyces sp. NPDC006798 TaxID=3155462 RepID=UPI0033CA1B2C